MGSIEISVCILPPERAKVHVVTMRSVLPYLENLGQNAVWDCHLLTGRQSRALQNGVKRLSFILSRDGSTIGLRLSRSQTTARHHSASRHQEM